MKRPWRRTQRPDVRCAAPDHRGMRKRCDRFPSPTVRLNGILVVGVTTMQKERACPTGIPVASQTLPWFLEKAETAIGYRHKPGGIPSRHRIGRDTSLVALAASANRETASHRCGSRQSNWPASKIPRQQQAMRSLPTPLTMSSRPIATATCVLPGEYAAGPLIFQVRQQDVTEVPLSEHNNVVKTFPAEQTDQPFGISILPRGAWRRWSVANAH
jgi:hypothetical protein